MAPLLQQHGATGEGVVTFLFTDVESSTTLWERYPAAMKLALARHDAILGDAIGMSNGRIVKRTGDGVLAAFDSPTDALAACIAAQRGLQGAAADVATAAGTGRETAAPLKLKVRMALHTGAAEHRDGDYFGAALNRAARIMSAAHGEQVLVSEATAQCLAERLPEGVSLRALGEHRLRGLVEPQRLLQVVAGDLRSEFPPPASLAGGHSLPAERDAFVGRRETLDELARRFDARARLVSVLGLGGMGKTRFATHFGWMALGRFPGGVWFCDLSEARDADGIVSAVAHGLDVPLSAEDAVTQLGQAIAGREDCLVILDNFEQVVRHAEETLGRWLNRASRARFLVTTREVLGLAGEEVLALTPLAVTDAAALFRRRAEAAKPQFQPDADDEAAIEPLVKLLDGLPLAIELAAARVRVAPVRTLLARMDERFKLLASAGGRVDRQATLRAVFDWSWDLLSVAEKAALAQLSVFEGGFTLAAVEAVIDLAAYDDAPWPMDALQSLVQKSIVRQVAGDRFDLLVSMQEYAAEHLRSEGRYPGSGPGALLAAHARHGAYFAHGDDSATNAVASSELENLVVACRRAAARDDAQIAAATLKGAWEVLRSRGPLHLGVELASLVLALPALSGSASAEVHRVAGNALAACGNVAAALPRFGESLALARAAGDREAECLALVALGAVESHAGSVHDAHAHLAEALAIAREVRSATLQSEAGNALGNLAVMLGRSDEAQTHYEDALAVARAIGDREREGRIRANLGILHINAGNLDEACAHDEAALAIACAIGNRTLEATIRSNLGLLHQVQGRFDEAVEQLSGALALTRDLGNAGLESMALCNLGLVYVDLSRFGEARDHFEVALRIARELDDHRREGQILSHLALVHAREGDFGEARRCLDSGAVLLLEMADRFSLGILECNRAEAEHRAGRGDTARSAVTAATALAAEVRAGPHSELGVALARVRALVVA